MTLITEWSGQRDNCWSVKLYQDRAFARMPEVKWKDNSGNLRFREFEITGEYHTELLALAASQIEDDVDYDDEVYTIMASYDL